MFAAGQRLKRRSCGGSSAPQIRRGRFEQICSPIGGLGMALDSFSCVQNHDLGHASAERGLAASMHGNKKGDKQNN